MRGARNVGVVLVLVVLTVAITLTGCDSAGTGGGDGTSISTVKWLVDEDRYYEFSTNDAQYFNWGFWVTIDTSKPTIDSEVSIKKVSGSQGGGFGMVFDYADENNYHRILITATGHYQFGKKENGVFEELQTWTPSPAINTGYNQINTIRAVIDGTACTVTINETEVGVFTITPFNGTSVGAYAAVTTETAENFPDDPVDVRARITKPTESP